MRVRVGAEGITAEAETFMDGSLRLVLTGRSGQILAMTTVEPDMPGEEPGAPEVHTVPAWTARRRTA